MKVVIQRVTRGSVTIEGEVRGQIKQGLVVLVGVAEDDSEDDAKYLAEKCANLRIFNDENNKMNLSVMDVKGGILSISQFTLYADSRKGRRPSFIGAANPEKGEFLYKKFNDYLSESGLHVEKGEFGAMMDIDLINSGPVTIIIESRQRFTQR